MASVPGVQIHAKMITQTKLVPVNNVKMVKKASEPEEEREIWEKNHSAGRRPLENRCPGEVRAGCMGTRTESAR